MAPSQRFKYGPMKRRQRDDVDGQGEREEENKQQAGSCAWTQVLAHPLPAHSQMAEAEKEAMTGNE